MRSTYSLTDSCNYLLASSIHLYFAVGNLFSV